MTEFVKMGVLTAEGKQVVAYFESLLKPLDEDRDPSKFNQLAGIVKEYGVNVRMLKALSPEQFLEGRSYGAETVYELIRLNEQREQDHEQTEQVSTQVKSMLEQFETLKAELQTKIDEQKAEIDALKSVKAAPKSKGKTEETPAETEDQPE